jgi:hypothetical protein
VVARDGAVVDPPKYPDMSFEKVKERCVERVKRFQMSKGGAAWRSIR